MVPLEPAATGPLPAGREDGNSNRPLGLWCSPRCRGMTRCSAARPPGGSASGRGSTTVAAACSAPRRRPSRRASVCPPWGPCSPHRPRQRRSCLKPGRRGRRDWRPPRFGPTPADPPPSRPGSDGGCARGSGSLPLSLRTHALRLPGLATAPRAGFLLLGFTGSTGPDPSCSFPFLPRLLVSSVTLRLPWISEYIRPPPRHPTTQSPTVCPLMVRLGRGRLR
uniref:PTPRF interacting protein alpha 4 n=1 Tax=Papio anubis TaxID=9555 RepID=A0A2I3M3Y5_PAPAN